MAADLAWPGPRRQAGWRARRPAAPFSFLKLPRSMLTDSSPKAAAVDAANPLLVEVTRGSQVESRHRAAVAVVDTDGKLVVPAGDPDRPVYARSALQSLPALALLQRGRPGALHLTAGARATIGVLGKRGNGGVIDGGR